MIAPSSSSNTLSSSLPDDIRLKCSYYAAQIKTQVDGMYAEQHKWLEDHLIEIKHTLAKVNEKKAGTRAVMAGIIKTPSRKRTKLVSKKISKPDRLAFDQLSDKENTSASRSYANTNSTYHPHALSELKRSNLNLNSSEIQQILNRQAEEQRKEIQARLQKELSTLDKQYESPTKKSQPQSSSSFVPGELSTQPLAPLWNSADSILSPTFHRIAASRNPDVALSQLQMSAEMSAQIMPPSRSIVTQPAFGDGLQEEIEMGHDSVTSTSTGEEAEVNDAFAVAGHELSAIQEGEEEDDQPTFEQPPPMPGLWETQMTNQPSQAPISQEGNASTSMPLAPSMPVAVEAPSLPVQTSPVPFSRSHPSTHSPVLPSDPDTNSAGPIGVDSDPVAADTPAAARLPDAPHGLANTDLGKPMSDDPQRDVSMPKVSETPAHKPMVSQPVSQPTVLSAYRASSSHAQGLAEHPVATISSTVADRPTVSVSPTESEFKPQPCESTVAKSLSPTVVQVSATVVSSKASSNPPASQIACAPALNSLVDEEVHQAQSREAPRPVAQHEPSHVDTLVEVPLNDNPSALRNNLHVSIGATHTGKLSGQETRTPGGSAARNFFTPGNTRPAVIQSPQSKWSSKPSTTSWTQLKPHKTPGMSYGTGVSLGVGKSEMPKGVLAISPGGFEDSTTTLNLQSNTQGAASQSDRLTESQASASSTQRTSIIDPQEYRPAGYKRTSTEAGFAHSSEMHEAKMTRSHTPGALRVRSSAAGGVSKKGMEDLKNRLSKIQRESAMHERVYHNVPSSGADGPSGSNQRTSLVTNASHALPFSKPLPAAHTSVHVPAGVHLAKSSVLVPPIRSASSGSHDRERVDDAHTDSQSKHPFVPPPFIPGPGKGQAISSTAEQLVFPTASQSQRQHAAPSAQLLAASGSEALAAPQQVQQQIGSSSLGDLAASYGANKPAAPNAGSTAAGGSTAGGSVSPSTAFSLLPHDKSVEPVNMPVATKVEHKHLAFLKGGVAPSTTPPHSPPAVPEKAAEPDDCRAADDESEVYEEAHDDSRSRLGGLEEVDDEEQHSVRSVQHSETHEAEEDEEEQRSVVSHRLSEAGEAVRHSEEEEERGSARRASEEEEAEQHHQYSDEEQHHQHLDEDQHSDEEHLHQHSDEEQAEGRNGDLSIDMVNASKAGTHNQTLENEHELYESTGHSNKTHGSELMQSVAPGTPQSSQAGGAKTPPASSGFMGVFKAGAALASSWTGTKAKPELKSLQLAAAAAKKEQEERDRKAALREVRRQAAVEKKQAEEKSKAESERKARQAEAEKKKHEREEAVKARSALKAKSTASHSTVSGRVDACDTGRVKLKVAILEKQSASRQVSLAGEAAKKRKMEPEPNRPVEQKKAKPAQKAELRVVVPTSAQKPSTSSYQPSRVAPAAPGSSVKPPATKSQHTGSTAIAKSQPAVTQKSQVPPPSRPPSQISQHSMLPKPGKASTGQSSHGATGASSKASSQVVAAASVKGKMREEKKSVEEEYIELPDIDSEYSDDDESEHERKEAKLPDWAQSPALREALANQRKVNPDDVFGGAIPPPKMNEIFRGRASRFRHRTSSANWTGTDGLTALEEAEYAKRMGYHNNNNNNNSGSTSGGGKRNSRRG